MILNEKISRSIHKEKIPAGEVADLLPEVVGCLESLEEACRVVQEENPSTYQAFNDTGRCYLVAGGFPRDLVSNFNFCCSSHKLES